MNIELYRKVCEELEIPKFKECLLSPEHDCLLSLGYGKGERAKYCAMKDSITCEFRSEKEDYPDFTPTVQLELVKFFIRQEKLIINYIFTSNEYGITSTDYAHNDLFVKDNEFANALLKLVLQIAQLSKKAATPIIDKEELVTIIIKGTIYGKES